MSGLTAHFLFAENFRVFRAFLRENPLFGGQDMRFPARIGHAGVLETMAVKLEAIRSAAERVAVSHGLNLVDIELVGPSKERILRVFLEKNAEGREKLKAAILAGAEDENLPERLVHEIQEGTLSLDRLALAQQMHNKKQNPIFGKPFRWVPLFIAKYIYIVYSRVKQARSHPHTNPMQAPLTSPLLLALPLNFPAF